MTSIPAPSATFERKRRKGSPWTGLGTVFLKEIGDHLGGPRMIVLELLVVLTGLGAVYTSIQDLRTITAEDPFLFLRLFTHAREPLPSFVGLLGFLIPVVAIGLGFDSVNSEFSRRTMSRILAQPIYRDALLLGKFLGGLATMAVGLVALWLLIVGLGLLLLGVPPSGEEIARGLIFLAIAIAYAGVWLAAAMFFSVVFRSAATAALAALGLWLLFSVLWPIIVPFVAQTVTAPNPLTVIYGIPDPSLIHLEQTLAAFSPNTLFGDATLAVLHPSTRALGMVFASQLRGAVMGAPLPLDQSIALVWPQVTGLIAATILVFTVTYVVFQRQEIRA